MSRWLTIDVERVLTVDRGRDVIVCDRGVIDLSGGAIVVRLSEESCRRLLLELAERGGNNSETKPRL